MPTRIHHLPFAFPPCRFAAPPAALRRMAMSAVLASACSGMQAPAFAQAMPGTPSAAPAPADDDAPAEGLWQRATLLGDLGGLRSTLGNHGVTFTLQETSEYLTNFTGGTRRLGAYDGLTQAALVVDTSKLFGLAGGTFNVSALQIHGTDLSSRALSSLQNASGIEADASTRLWELWYGQSIGGGAADIRIGQQSVDQEFMVSQTANGFINATFGWPVLPSVDMPGGGPAYPLSALGVRVKAQPTHALTLLAGVFDGNPGGAGQADAQRANAHGTNFNLHDSALWIGELQYAPDAPPGGLPGTYKLGAWYLSGPFSDPHTDTGGLSLAAPDSNGIARTHRGDYGAYAIADQMVWRSTANPSRSLGVFVRVMGAPDDRNPISVAAQAGVSLKAPFAGRDNDTAGIALGYTNATLNVDGTTSDLARPRRVNETIIEATYQYQVAPWWTLQGDLQYIVRPGGGFAAPAGGTIRPIGNAFVAGLRTVIDF